MYDIHTCMYKKLLSESRFFQKKIGEKTFKIVERISSDPVRFIGQVPEVFVKGNSIDR